MIKRTGYLIDAASRPIKICRPGSRDPSFYVNTMNEAFTIIDLDIELAREAGYDPFISVASPAPEDAKSPS